jgi:hypothetical protein
MNTIEIDYSEVQNPGVVGGEANDWEASVHKYFGKKLENGKREKEPIYTYIEFPRMMYTLRGEKIAAKVFQCLADIEASPESWETTPAVFGYIGAPSFEQVIALREAAEVAAQEKTAADKKEAAEAVVAALSTDLSTDLAIDTELAVDAVSRGRGRPSKIA